jgi:hypothetical protein
MEGDGWLSGDKGGYGGRWVAKEGDGCLRSEISG